MGVPEFTVDVFQNEYLPAGGGEVNAIVTVTGADFADDGPAAVADVAEIIIVDCSGSMNTPRSKIAEARAATAAAVDVIRDGVAFAVIAGTHQATAIFPADGSLAVADARTRKAAKKAVARLRPGGGTAIGQWLRLAHEMFSAHPAQLRHAILLADGKDEHESPADLDEAISLCEGVFSCDCRGLGTGWKLDELRKISTALLGTVDIVPDPAGLAASFEAMMRASMAKKVADVALRVWTPQHAAVRFVKQVAPPVGDLTDRRTQVAPQTGDYPTGAWGTGERRDYHLCVQLAAAGAVGQELLAARVSLVAASPSGPEVLGQGLVRAVWTDDEALSIRIDKHVAHYTGRAELAQAIQEGLEARKLGDEATAAAKLGRAVQIAHESGNQETARLLAKVVEVIDPATGTVRLKPEAAGAGRRASGGMFERFTDRARRVVVLAQEEARMLNHDYIGTEHLLLGLIREGEGAAAKALESLGISLEAVRQQVEEIISRGQQAPSGHIPFTPRAKKALELSLREALQLGHNYIGTEHLLLGLIREGEGVAAQVLVKLGADLNRVRQQVIQLLHGYQGKEPASAGAGQQERGSAADLLSRIDAIESRLLAIEQRVGIAPDTGGLDRQIRQARSERHAAVNAEDYEQAASLRDREKELLAEKASRQQEWVAAHPDLPSLAEKVRQLSDEIEQLRGLLRQQGTEPEEGTA
jgi:hypothetical protein